MYAYCTSQNVQAGVFSTTIRSPSQLQRSGYMLAAPSTGWQLNSFKMRLGIHRRNQNRQIQ